MNTVPIQDVSFDDKATRAMGAAFDQACVSLRHLARADKVRELIAKRIIEAAINGERDPICPGDAGRALAAAIPGARLALVPGAGHAPFLSRPAEVAAAAGAFLEAA